jgi:hypothetical protein
MQLSNQFATIGLVAVATPESTNTANSNVIGLPVTRIGLPETAVAYSIRTVIIGDGSVFRWNIDTLATTGTTAFVAGNAQMETATAAGTASADGNVTATVTSAGMTGSPLALTVAVTNGDTAATWAEKVRVALAADAVISERFTVGGSTNIITITGKATTSFGVDVYPANDATLNIALANGSPNPDITPAASSVNTIEGVQTVGAKIIDGDGDDIYGDAITSGGAVHGILIEVSGGLVYYADLTNGTTQRELSADATVAEFSPVGFPTIPISEFENASANISQIKLTVFTA